ncbi:glycerol-3-phosphate dehydrogenase (NAD(P)+) [Geodermatophilus bullaregiensis]|uniref:NAD(P)H-dependent glycerol-3-phosphate dehydrogenase n=1 Tax=Geodermatophilus bullaregiensis TaxID=1564160 RepID=UPI0019570D56|nr:NAD(P)H-dependent glycerol-3-phosphate dehydrogenase [Geodermatophilus bullaregiensis]MBM7805523.1 glycerol-3-phosphate dehydrogenase (NAD(P)+) [Geodermatophilus bullaregiensis]
MSGPERSGRGTRAAVLGAGSWGTTFAKVLADAGCTVSLHARRPELCQAITETGENPDYLPGVKLPGSLTATTDAAQALDGADVVVLAVPSQSLRDNLLAWTPLLPPDSTLLSLMKGVELGSTKRMSEVIREVTGAGPDRVAALSGPNLAREIAEEQPAATVIACPDVERAEAVQAACHTPYFRPYTNRDLVGCELGGAVKNVIALACGMAEGMGFGDNTRASLITRGLAETARLGTALGAELTTFAGLAGLGDLVATCSSPLSRNRTFGERLGRGMSLEEVQRTTRQVAEGVKSCRPVLELARAHDVDVPLTEAVVRVCHEGVSAAQIVKEIMSREAKPE